jgi:hypothetical protein
MDITRKGDVSDDIGAVGFEGVAETIEVDAKVYG